MPSATSARLGLAIAAVAGLAIVFWFTFRGHADGASPTLDPRRDAEVSRAKLEAPRNAIERSSTPIEVPAPETKPEPAESENAAATRREILRRSSEWLLSQQDEDGGFGAALEGTSASFRREGWTGLALLALLSDGDGTRDPQQRAAVERGLEFLLQRMSKEGAEAGLIGRADDGAALFNHGFAATALLEGAQLLGREDLLSRAREASSYLVRRSTDPTASHLGGDPFTTVWATMAMASGSTGENGFDAALKERVQRALAERTDPETGIVGRAIPGFDTATPIGGLAHDPESGSQSATAAALFARLLCGEAPEPGSLLARQAQSLAAHSPVASPDGRTHDFLYWQLGTLATLQAGGEAWTTWSTALERTLLSAYRRDGAPFAAEGPWARDAGSLGFVASAACSLQVLERFARHSHPSAR